MRSISTPKAFMHTVPVRRDWRVFNGCICHSIVCCECDFQIKLGYDLSLLLVLCSTKIMVSMPIWSGCSKFNDFHWVTVVILYVHRIYDAKTSMMISAACI